MLQLSTATALGSVMQPGAEAFYGYKKRYNWKKGLGIGMLVGGMGLDIYGQMQEKSDFAGDLEFEAAQRRSKAGQIASITQETLHDTLVAEQYAKGAAKAEQTGAGTAVGTGSNITQVASISAAFRRKRELIAKKAGAQRYSLESEARELEERAKKTKKTDWWSIGASVLAVGLTGGLAAGLLAGGVGLAQGGANEGWW